MKLIEINWHPTDRQLRQFGVICTFALPIIGWAWGGNHSSLVALFAIGLLCGIAGFTVPTLLKPFFVALSIVTAPIGLAVGELALLLIYFCVFVPLGIVFRLIGRDSLHRRIDRDSKSYWETKNKPRDVTSYYRQS